MDPVNKALWYIETHLELEFSMEDVAENAGVTRFHLSRLFAVMIGQSVMRYARGRRLSLAAAALAGGAPDILSSPCNSAMAPTKPSAALSANNSASRRNRFARSRSSIRLSFRSRFA